MNVPVVGIDRISPADRVRVRTELRRAQFSAYEVENMVIAITGQVDAVRKIAMRYCTLAPRVRRLDVDGEELRQAHDEPGQFKQPGQFKDPLQRKIASFWLWGMEAARQRLVGAMKAAGFEAEDNPDDGSVLVEYQPARRAEMEALAEDIYSELGLMLRRQT